MGDIALLTKAAIYVIVTGPEETLFNFTPTVQVLGIRKVQDEKNRLIFRLQISDGEKQFTAIKLGPACAAMVEKKELSELAIIKLKNYKRGKLSSDRFIIVIQKLEIIKKGYEVGEVLGNPQVFCNDITPWMEQQYKHSLFPDKQFDGSGELDPGLRRVISDIAILQKAVISIGEEGGEDPQVGKMVQQLILEFEQTKYMHCSSYGEAKMKLGEIMERYHKIFEALAGGDKTEWQDYDWHIRSMHRMLSEAPDKGYPGIENRLTVLASPRKSRLKPKRIDGNFVCGICQSVGSNLTDEELNKRGALGLYPCAHPTLNNVDPKFEFEMQTICSQECDKVRECIEATMLRNDGIRVSKKDLKWNLCQVCFLEKKLKKCGYCKLAYYCSKACQQKHWPKHEYTCKTLQNINQYMSTKLSTRTSGDINSLEKQMDFNH